MVNKKFSKKKPIILVKRVLNDKGQLDRIDVEIYSESLREILFEINKDVQGIDMTGEVPTVRSSCSYSFPPDLTSPLG